MPRKSKIAVITTGGTIACTTDNNGHLTPTVSGEELLKPIISRFDTDNTVFELHELTRLDSSSMTFADIDKIIAKTHAVLADPDVTGIVITHGTDSMEETAIAVDLFHSDSRPIVFTGAQKPFDHPESDGPKNLFEACLVVSEPSAQGIGVLIVFGHAVLPARGCIKWHTSDEMAFATNAPDEPERPTPLPLTTIAEQQVDIVCAYPGAGTDLIDTSINHGARGLIIEALGSGNVGSAMAAGISQALAAGIKVVITTRVPRGEVSGTYGGAGGGATLAEHGALGARYFRAGQARIILAVALAAKRDPAGLF